MTTPRLARRPAVEPHVCPACELPFVEPDFGVQKGALWRVALSCHNCGWWGVRLLDEDRLELLERAIDAERSELQADLEALIAQNMGEYVERFTSALTAGAILPEDF
jgi:hypothetical protein